jgi:hypothetical protein
MKGHPFKLEGELQEKKTIAATSRFLQNCIWKAKMEIPYTEIN